jgi:prephenate dehydratase
MSDGLKIAIQGGKASFHDMATRAYFSGKPVDLYECQTFRQLCEALIANKVDMAVMAVENTLVGSILPNYSLLEAYPLYIVGETYLRIQQNLMALPGQTIEDIRYVKSHPMALLQCSEFLENHPHIRSIESFDTAESAREIRQQNLKGVAAIAGKMAANRYQLSIIAEEIENIKQNYTRFLILIRREEKNGRVGNKASLNFRVSHRVGSLVEALNVFRANHINLTLIQSIPIPGLPNEYAFHVDFEWERETDFFNAIEEAQPFCKGLKILGIYEAGVIPYDHPVRQTVIAG